MITLKKAYQPEATILSNLFIDHYMPEANGEFVKVYIYLVRTLSSAPVSFSLEQMADHLLCTEKDILRALKYWAKIGFLSLSYDAEKQIQDITLHSPEASENKDTAISVSNTKIPSSVPQPQQADNRSLSQNRIQELKNNEEIVQLLYIAEQYLGKTLTSTEMQKILFFYDELKMSSVLIEYLIEYCVSKNHRSIRYMEKTALAWIENGITTVEEAKASSALFSKDYFTILKYLGISGRNPVENEIAIMDIWMKTFGFSMEIIQEACSRAVLKTGKPSFEYTHSILKDWNEHKVRSLSDIQTLDSMHRKNASKPSVKQQKGSSAPNRFNNFSQREYDFKDYEKRFFNQ